MIKLVTLGLMVAQADGAPVWMTCQPASVRVAQAGENHEWTCQSDAPNCRWRNYELNTFDRRGTEQVSDHSDTQDEMTVRTVTRIFDDGRYEEIIEWRDRAGQVPFREASQGRCTPGMEPA